MTILTIPDDYCIFSCDKCGVCIIIGPRGDPRNYLYPPPDFDDFCERGYLPETQILCHDCYLSAEIEDHAALNGCSECGEPVREVKFFGSNGVLCNDCTNRLLEGDKSDAS